MTRLVGQALILFISTLLWGSAAQGMTARIYRDGDKVGRDPVKAVRCFDLACDRERRKYPPSCSDLTALLNDPDGGAHDPAAAREVNGQICARTGNRYACNQVE